MIFLFETSDDFWAIIILHLLFIAEDVFRVGRGIRTGNSRPSIGPTPRSLRLGNEPLIYIISRTLLVSLYQDCLYITE